METKVLINVKEGILELSGSEAFVSKYLDIYHTAIKFGDNKVHMTTVIPEAVKIEDKGASKQVRRKGSRSKSIPLEKFDLHKDSKSPSLEEFLQAKNPGKRVADYIAIIGYYITKIKGSVSFCEGNVDYAFRTLNIPNRPVHLRQIMINAKNNDDLFDLNEDGSWSMSRTGEIFVEEKLA